MRKQPTISRADLDNYFASTEDKRKPTPFDQRYGHHTYRIRDDLHETVKGIAADRGLRLYDLIDWILARFVDQLQAGEVVLPVEEYVTTQAKLVRGNGQKGAG